jgi:hypothetical protein
VTAQRLCGQPEGCGDNSNTARQDQQVARQSRIAAGADLFKEGDYSPQRTAKIAENPYESSAFPLFTFV